jgi:hypothetical protein
MAGLNGPLLDLHTLIERPTVKIDGVEYELRTPGELTLEERARAGLVANTLRAEPASPSPEAAADMSRAIDQICRIVLLAPDAVQQRLKDVHRLQIVETFIALSTTRRRPQPGAPTPRTTTDLRTGASSSRASSASTGACRRTGSPRSPSRSSAAA